MPLSGRTLTVTRRYRVTVLTESHSEVLLYTESALCTLVRAIHRSAIQHSLFTLRTGSPETLSATETCTLDPADPIVVLITAPSAAEAQTLAHLLVEENLAACVQILPSMESVYRWEGKVERASEVLLLVKTFETQFQELETRVRAVHSYETPEIVAIPVTAISSPYLEWLAESLDST